MKNFIFFEGRLLNINFLQEIHKTDKDLDEGFREPYHIVISKIDSEECLYGETFKTEKERDARFKKLCSILQIDYIIDPMEGVYYE